jgi:hypothetical protein
MKSGVIAIFLILFVTLTGYAGGDTAQVFIKRCEYVKAFKANKTTSPDQSFFAGYCVGVIQGLSDGHLYTSTYNRNNPLFCIPETISKGQLIEIAIDYAKVHPEVLQQPELVLLVKAFTNKFPCR